MTTKSILTIFLFLFFCGVKAQQFSEYKGLYCVGDIPEDITKRTSKKIKEGIESDVSSSDKRKVAKSKATFILKSNYILDELLTSGNILFGDEVSSYVNAVADKILENEPALRKELRFYCVKSNLSNAFCTHQGMIFVTLGLISQLENEAQLSFVLSHEITHYKKKHSINSILESEKIIKRSKSKKTSFDDNIIKLSNYSKSLELEADSAGFQRIKNVGYDVDAALSTFDVLQFSFLPYYEVPFDYSPFENEFYTIPDEYKLTDPEPINFEVNENDSRSTHPNLNKRREVIRNLKGEVESGKVFLIGDESEFKHIRNLCRYEGLRIDLAYRSYVKAYYDANYLIKNDSNSYYLKKSKFKALYGLSMYKLRGATSVLEFNRLNHEGQISQAYHFFDKISAEEITLFAIKNGWELLASYDNSVTRRRLESLIEFSINQGNLDVNELISQLENNEKQENTEPKLKSGNLSKYEQLKNIKKQDEQLSKNEYHILKDVANKDELIAYLSEYSNSKTSDSLKNQPGNSTYDVNAAVSNYKLEQEKDKVHRKTRNHLGLDKIVFIEPDFQKIDERKGVKLENSEDGKYTFNEQIKMVAQESEIAVDLLAPKIMDNHESNKYNDISNINYCINESLSHNKQRKGRENSNTNAWSFIPSGIDFIETLNDQYGTNYFGYTGVVKFKAKKNLVAIRLIGSIVVPYYLPFAIAYAVTPQHYLYYYTLVYDIEKCDVVISEVFELDYEGHQSNINSLMYDLFTQMKTPKNI